MFWSTQGFQSKNWIWCRKTPISVKHEPRYIYLEAANVIIVSRICFCLYTWHISSMQLDFRILCITTKRTVNTSYLFHLLVLKTNLTSRKEKHIMVLLNSIIYIYWYIYITRWFHTQWLVFIYNILINWYFMIFLIRSI